MNAAAVSSKYPPLLLKQHNNDIIRLYCDGTEQTEKDRKVTDLLEQQCLRSGSSLEGRIASFRRLTGTLQKSAVMISERTRLLYFPIFSMEDPECIWVRYDAVMQLKGSGARGTEVLFDSGIRCVLPVDRRVVKQQMQRCAGFIEQLQNAAEDGQW